MPVTPADPLPVQPAGPPPVELRDDEQDRLLGLARLALAVAVGARRADELRRLLEASPLPDLRAGAFVTLTEDGRLRGCMGTLDEEQPAWASVLEAARMAALADPRFAAVGASELAVMHVEVSVLGPMTPLEDPAAFRPGIDGLLIERGYGRGLLLPEVAEMLEPRHDAMLEAVCRKAGLPGDAWRDPRATLLAFRTCRFGGPAG
jgi:AmmeMemoRadiSam system protein A